MQQPSLLSCGFPRLQTHTHYKTHFVKVILHSASTSDCDSPEQTVQRAKADWWSSVVGWVFLNVPNLHRGSGWIDQLWWLLLVYSHKSSSQSLLYFIFFHTKLHIDWPVRAVDEAPLENLGVYGTVYCRVCDAVPAAHFVSSLHICFCLMFCAIMLVWNLFYWEGRPHCPRECALMDM